MTNRQLGYVLGLICFANFLSYLDRQIVSALGPEIIAHFALSKQEFGWVGSTFTIGYMIFAPVVSFLIHRHSRPKVFAACVIVWSLATIASGYAPTKWVLYATRFFIGVGEAGCLVIGPTLLSDFFSKEVRGRVLSAFFLALPLGGTAGYIVGGLLAEWFGWQQAFLLAGIPGFVVAGLLWILPDPPPEGGAAAAGHAAPGFRMSIELLKNRTLFLIILAQAFAVMFLQPLLHYGVTFFQEERGLSKKEATITLGVIALVAGGLGNMLSGFIGDRLAKRVQGAYALLAGIAFTAGLPCLLIGFTASSRAIALPALGLGAFCYFLCMPAVNTQIANAVRSSQRAMAWALAVFILHLLGDTFANPAFGASADALHSMQKAFFIFSFSLLLAGAACFLASRTAARDEARAAEEKPAQG